MEIFFIQADLKILLLFKLPFGEKRAIFTEYDSFCVLFLTVVNSDFLGTVIEKAFGVSRVISFIKMFLISLQPPFGVQRYYYQVHPLDGVVL